MDFAFLPAAAYELAFAMTVPPPAVTANRDQRSSSPGTATESR